MLIVSCGKTKKVIFFFMILCYRTYKHVFTLVGKRGNFYLIYFKFRNLILSLSNTQEYNFQIIKEL